MILRTYIHILYTQTTHGTKPKVVKNDHMNERQEIRITNEDGGTTNEKKSMKEEHEVKRSSNG